MTTAGGPVTSDPRCRPRHSLWQVDKTAAHGTLGVPRRQPWLADSRCRTEREQDTAALKGPSGSPPGRLLSLGAPRGGTPASVAQPSWPE